MPLRDHFRPPVSERSSWEGSAEIVNQPRNRLNTRKNTYAKSMMASSRVFISIQESEFELFFFSSISCVSWLKKTSSLQLLGHLLQPLFSGELTLPLTVRLFLGFAVWYRTRRWS